MTNKEELTSYQKKKLEKKDKRTNLSKNGVKNILNG